MSLFVVVVAATFVDVAAGVGAAGVGAAGLHI